MMLFDSFAGLLRVVLIAILAYGTLILLLRLAGKRALAKLNAFDLVVTVALGSTLATILLNDQVAFAEGATAFAMLCLLQWLVARGSLRWSWFRGAIRSEPQLLLANGRPLERAMAEERVTIGEVEAAIRSKGIGRIEEVAAVILESDGSISVIPARDTAHPLTALRSVSGWESAPDGS